MEREKNSKEEELVTQINTSNAIVLCFASMSPPSAEVTCE